MVPSRARASTARMAAATESTSSSTATTSLAVICWDTLAGRVNIRYPSSPSRFLEKRWIWMIRVSTKAAIKRPEAQGAHRHSDDIIERGAEPLQVPQQEVGQHRRQDQAAIHGDTHPRDRLPLVSNQFAQHANTSRNRVSTDLPVSSRMASTSLCRTMTPSRIKTTSSSTRSMSAIRWVESRTLASSL